MTVPASPPSGRPDGRGADGRLFLPVLQVDPIACDGHGLCAEILPEWIGLDDWGYPAIPRQPLPPHLRALAERAVKACPTLALRLAADGG